MKQNYLVNIRKINLFNNKPIKYLLIILLLTTQNLIIFQKHYFHDYGFPWDFVGGYYSMVAFWTSVVSQNVYPSWVPYTQFGLPINLLLQSGIHYPPLWVFPLIKIEYTLHAAVVFQCLHILFGTIGMFFLLRLLLHSTPQVNIYALLGAFVFQFFGGFYSNAEHVDIIRAFSFYPWLFYFYSLPKSAQTTIPRHFYFIPLIILFLITGAYPGNYISGLAIIALYVLFQLTNLYLHKREITAILSTASSVLMFTFLGFGLSVFHLGPAWLYKDYLFRSTQISQLTFFSLGLQHVPALFLQTNMALGEISMTSTYITLPALILVCYLPLRTIKQQWPMMGVLFFSLVMVGGPKSSLWYLITKFIPPLRYSRFPASDYRSFIAIVLIFFAILALKALVERELSWKYFLFRTGFVFIWFIQGIYIYYPVLRSTPVYIAFTICIVIIIGLALYLFTNKKYLHKFNSLFIFLVILISIDAIRVLPNLAYITPDGRAISTWQVPSFSKIYQTNKWPLTKNGRLLTYEIMRNTPYTRPARVEPKTRMETWVALITGQYNTGANSTPILESAFKINEQKVYKEFMTREWIPLFFDKQEYEIAENNAEIPLQLLNAKLSSSTYEDKIQVRQLSYGINKIEYRVFLTKSMLMLENETFFPGWTASLALDQESSRIQAISVNGLFRAWLLPAGEYTMTAQFDFPHIQVYNGISIVSLIIWLLLIYHLVKKQHIIHTL